MDDKLSININIADRLYPLRVDRKEEEDIRKAAKIINEKVVQYSKNMLVRIFRIASQWRHCSL